MFLFLAVTVFFIYGAAGASLGRASYRNILNCAAMSYPVVLQYFCCGLSSSIESCRVVSCYVVSYHYLQPQHYYLEVML